MIFIKLVFNGFDKETQNSIRNLLINFNLNNIKLKDLITFYKLNGPYN